MKKAKTAPAKNDVSADQAILQAFVQVQFEKGVSHVVLQDVAKKAGVAFGTVRYHFNDSGKDLAQEALLFVMKSANITVDEKIYQQRLGAKTAGIYEEKFNPLHAYIHAMFDWIRDFPAESSLLAYYYYLCSSKTQVIVPNQIFLQRARLRIEALIHEAVGRALYSSPPDMSGAALQIHGVIMGTCLIAGTQRLPEFYEEQKNLCLKLVDKLLS